MLCAMWCKGFSQLKATNTRWVRNVQIAAQGGYLHHPGSEPLNQQTLGDVVAATAHKYPSRVAVKSLHEGITVTYEELLKQADSLGLALRASGLEKGDRVGIWTHNCSAWIIGVIAAARAGLISVLINPVYEKKEMSFCIRKAGLRSIIFGDRLPNRNYYKILEQIIPELHKTQSGILKSKDFQNLISLINCGKEKLPGTSTLDSFVSGHGSRSGLISKYGSEVTSKDGSIIHFTSGTTGEPKAPLDSHLGVVNNTYFVGKRNTLHERHHNICVQVPLFHALGSIVTILSGLRHGSTLTLAAPTYNVDANINAMLGEQCTMITGTPTMYVDMLSKIRNMGEVPSKLRVALAAGAPCSPNIIMDMKKYLKTEAVKCLYGMTETTACVFQSIEGDSTDLVADTVGYIQDHVEAKVVNETGETVPFGAAGELVVRGYNSMICYWDEPEKTKETLDEDGWLRTGDKMTISEDGYGRIVGRLKDIIVRGGENIAPKEIEDLLNTHPDIVESQVVGVPDDRLGEELCAVLKVRDGASVKLEDVSRFCTGNIARFKIPRLLKIVDDFPKTTSGKIQKFKIKELIEVGKI